jgi:hypothetical protein
MKSRLFRFATLLGLGALAAPALLASIGKPLALSVTPDTPARGGDTVSVSLKVDPADVGKDENYALLVIGTRPGSFPFFELMLDIIPQAYFYIGEFPTSGPNEGTIAFDVKLPNPLPPGSRRRDDPDPGCERWPRRKRGHVRVRVARVSAGRSAVRAVVRSPGNGGRVGRACRLTAVRRRPHWPRTRASRRTRRSARYRGTCRAHARGGGEKDTRRQSRTGSPVRLIRVCRNHHAKATLDLVAIQHHVSRVPVRSVRPSRRRRSATPSRAAVSSLPAPQAEGRLEHVLHYSKVF